MKGALLCDLTVQAVDQIVELESQCNRPPWSRRMFVEEFRHRHSMVLGLQAGPPLIGYSIAHVIANEAYVLKLGIAPCFRGNGLGKFFFGEVLDRLWRAGGREVWLEVRQGNVIAQALYRGFGFSVRGVRVAYYSDDGENATVMAAHLPCRWQARDGQPGVATLAKPFEGPFLCPPANIDSAVAGWLSASRPQGDRGTVSS